MDPKENNKEKKDKLIQLLFTDSTLDKCADLQMRWDARSRSEVIRRCISDAHKKEFPDYITVQRDRTRMDPIQKAKIRTHAKIAAEMERDEQKTIRTRSHLENICSILGGTITTNDAGRPACTYTMYSMSGPSKIDESVITTDLENLNDESPTYQFQDVFGQTGDRARANFELVRNGERPVPPPVK